MSEVTAVPLRPVSKSGLTALWIGIVALILIGLGAGWWLSHGAAAAVAGGDQFLRFNAMQPGVHTTASGLQYKILHQGNGPKPSLADVAVIEYRGSFPNGVVFDQTRPGQRAPVQVNHVVPGFAEGLMLMPKGSTYRLFIPPKLGYGDQENGPIPANSVLVFDVTMHEAVSMQGMTPQGM